MKKKMLFLLRNLAPALLILLCLTGCHGSREQRAFQVPETLEDAPVEITFWAKNDTNKAQTDIYARAIEEFQSLYPGITVNLRLYTDYGKIYNDVITNIATGTTPNVCITYPDHIATYMTGDNVVVPLDDLMADERYGLGGSELLFEGPAEGELVPKFLEECRIQGAYYAVPYVRSTEVCYINKDYVEALGYEVPDVLTWDFIWEVSEAATEKDPEGNFKVNGQKVMIPFIYKSTDNMMISMLRQLDAGYSTPTGQVLLFNEDTGTIMKQVGEHAGSGAFSTFKISSYPANFLNAGQCIFAVDSTAGSTWMGTHAPLLDISEDKLVDFETVVRLIPQYDTSHPQMISQGPSICIFNKENEQEVLASWLFTQYLLSDGIQIAYAQTEGYVPVTTRALNSSQYQEYLSREGEDNELYYDVKLQAAKLFLENVDNTFTTPVFNGSTSLRDAAGQLIENAAKGARRKQVVDDAFVQTQFEDVTSLYRLDQILSGPEGPADLGPLPTASVALLVSLALIWGIMGAYILVKYVKKRRKSGEYIS